MNDLEPTSLRLVAPLRTDRFFTVPTVGLESDGLQYKAYLGQKHDRYFGKAIEEGIHIMRYAAYIRVSSEEQVDGYSLDAQRRAVKEWVAGKGGSLIKIYTDEGESATTANRTEFQKNAPRRTEWEV